MLEALSEDKYDALPSPRILNTHIDLGSWPQDFLKRKCKIIYLIRNPKDIAVSFYHHHGIYSAYTGKWEHYLEDLYLSGKVDSGSWFDHLQQYEDFLQENPDYPIHLMAYEDLHKVDGVNELTRLMEFLEKDVKTELLEKVYDKNRFDEVKKDKAELVQNERLHPIWLPMYRKGKIGDWKNQFTVAQNEMFDAEYNKRMKHSNISMKWT
ncbi:hypothetical protein FSP39_023838 [Pinctada imbricata]|uniref:Sulfotransferase domain-containing protein n=1 Tax=Pinctada imbricata TaxID=66713 RepID=A0AA88XT93_PINIB|nr:hypothetical protein FSP39_023838 [Pinctada imbricata]